MHKLKKITAKKNSGKYELQHVLVKDGKIVASDSFRLIEIEMDKVSDVESKIDEVIGGEINEEIDMLVPGYILKSGDTFEQDKVIRKDGSIFPVGESNTEQYPNYEKVVPTEEKLKGYSKITLNGKYLKELLDAIPKDKQEKITLHIKDGDNPLYFEGEGVKGLLMGVRE